MLGAALAAPLLRAWPRSPQAPGLHRWRAAPGRVAGAGGADASAIELSRDWSGETCHSRITNRGTRAVPIDEGVLFDVTLELPASTPRHGEWFQMLSQSGGTLGAPQDLGSYTDAKHYRIPM